MKKRVLCLDDDLTIARMVARIVEFCGHEPIIETSSVDALVRWSHGELSAAVVDFLMPGIDGLEVLAALEESSPKCRRILLTASPNEPRVRESVANGLVERCIAKPPSLDEMTGALDWLK